MAICFRKDLSDPERVGLDDDAFIRIPLHGQEVRDAQIGCGVGDYTPGIGFRTGEMRNGSRE